MKQVTNGDLEVIEILNRKYSEPEIFKRMRYCYSYKIDEGWLVLNGITQIMLLLSEEEYQTFFESDFAKQNYFSVSVDYNELQAVKDIRNELNARFKSKDNIPTKYTVFTTTACNARCAYCFEKGTKSVTMSKDTSLRVSEYIIDKCKDINEAINIHWFGGEPMLNTAVIDDICDRMAQNGVNYYSTMTSNGLLFEPTIMDKVVTRWKLKQIQITLDGTQNVYNKVKNYVGKEHNAFEKVIENIQMLLDAAINVEVRLNVSVENGENLIELVEELYKRFGVNEYLSVYCCSLLERDDNNEIRRASSDNILLETNELKLQKRMFELGLFKEKLRPILWTRRCSAERESEITIMPNGEIGICALYLTDNIIGNIRTKEYNREVIDSFKEHFEDLPECLNCDLYPQCLRLKKCKFDTNWCPEENRKMARQEMYQQMQYEFYCYVKNNGA